MQRPARRGAEREPADERRDEAVPPDRDGAEVGEQRECEDRQLLRHFGREPASMGSAQRRSADDAHSHGDDERQSDLLAGLDHPVTPACGLLRYQQRQEQRDERGDDAVVQAALDVERAADPDRDGPVREDRQSERRIRRRQDRGGERRCRPPRAREQEGGEHRTQRDRQRETDQEKATGDMGIALDLLEPDGGSVREQHHRERQLHTQQDGLARQRDAEPISDAPPEQHAGEDEDHRRGDGQALEPRRDERVQHEHDREEHDPTHLLVHLRPSGGRRLASGGVPQV